MKNKISIKSPYIRKALDKYITGHINSNIRKKSYINGLDGWYFSEKEILDASKKDELLTMDYEFAAPCRLNCWYCFKKGDNRNDIRSKFMTMEEWKSVIDQAVKLGLRSIKLLGDGELTESKSFFERIEYLHKKGVKTVLFTGGHVIGNDKLAKLYQNMSGREMAKKLLRLGVSVMVKVNSFIPEIQDTIVGSKGFTKDKDECLRRLLDTGFNKTNPTRLGLETSIMRTSPGELMEIYKLGSMLNMYINLNCFMPCGLTKNNKLTKRFDISRKDKFDLFKKVYKFNIDFGIPFRDVSPFAGGDPCSHLGYGLYVNSRGYAFCCCSGDDCIGHIRKNTIKQIWAKNPYKRKYKGCLSHGCPFRDKSNVMIDDWENKLRRYIQKEMDQKKWMKELYL